LSLKTLKTLKTNRQVDDLADTMAICQQYKIKAFANVALKM